MKKNFILLVIIFVLSSSCNRLSNDFFEFLFNSKNICLNRECSDNPSFFSEGRSFEVYSISENNTSLITHNIFIRNNFSRNRNYSRYTIPNWNSTSVTDKENIVYSFLDSEMNASKNVCFTKDDLFKVLRQEGNYYTILEDNLGRVKLFIWDYKNNKLFLVTSYEL